MPRPNLAVHRLEDRLVPAGLLDLTARGAQGAVNGAHFVQYDARPTGTGHIQSFLRVQGASNKGAAQEGYNTDARPLQFDENKSPQFTRALKLSEVPVVNVGGVPHREFLLDINQKASQPYLTLDRLQLFAGSAGDLRGYANGELAGADKVYDLDAGGDNWVKLDYRLNTGSGSGDMLLYVPDAAFASAGGEYVYLYSKFGEGAGNGQHFAGNAGFQEWAVGSGSSLVAGQLGSITGRVWLDADQNQAITPNDAGGDVWLAQETVYLDANNNGQLDADEAFTNTSPTDGTYSFTGLLGGYDYTVRLLTSYEQVLPQGLDATGQPSPLVIRINPGQKVTDADFLVQDGTDTGGLG